MSFLAPLYFAGLLAVSLPLVFHLIRRTPRGHQTFSSLMFLVPSPPRLTRRSRLDNLLLLLLRVSALVLLAIAFCRPFLRQAAVNDLEQDSRRIAILLDTSASMQRGELWERSLEKAREELSGIKPSDRIAIFTYDDQVNTILGFEELAVVAPASRQEFILERLSSAKPSWGGSDLGSALIAVSDALEETSDENSPSHGEKQLVLVSDLQQGSRISTLQSYEWPESVRLKVLSVSSKSPTNVGLQLLAGGESEDSEEEASQEDRPRIRVINSTSSQKERFQIYWNPTDSKKQNKSSMEVYVPAGQSRVVRAPERLDESQDWNQLSLRGDDYDFDNHIYILPRRSETYRVVYLGDDSADDPEGMHYFLEKFPSTKWRKIFVEALTPEKPLYLLPQEKPALVIVTQSVEQDRIEQLRRFMQQGGIVLFVLSSLESSEVLAKLMQQESLSIEEAEVEDYALLGQINFSHPLFTAMDDPRFNDFTRIHFWHHRRIKNVDGLSAQVLAEFDDGDPAILEKKVEQGKLFVMTSGWHQQDSQLARSSKFVPLLSAMLEESRGQDALNSQYFVHDSIKFSPPEGKKETLALWRPDGSQKNLSQGALSFETADQPGIYRVVSGNWQQPFAVNLSPAESKTSPLDLAELEQFGVRLRSREAAASEAQDRRQLRDRELESQQKAWRWLLLAALGLLFVESWLAGRLSRLVKNNPENQESRVAA